RRAADPALGRRRDRRPDRAARQDRPPPPQPCALPAGDGPLQRETAHADGRLSGAALYHSLLCRKRIAGGVPGDPAAGPRNVDEVPPRCPERWLRGGPEAALRLQEL